MCSLLSLLNSALEADYRPAATLDQIAWLRCLRAISEARAGRIENVHTELCLVQQQRTTNPVPVPNGEFRGQIRKIELTERSTIDFLKQLFGSYLEFLRRVHQHELANCLESRLARLLDLEIPEKYRK